MTAPDASAPRILVVEHEAICPPGHVGRWLAEAGARLDVRRMGAGDPLPDDLDDHDALLVLGGTMGAGDDATHPWLGPVKELIRSAASDDVPVLGICLGHQLVAVALGGEVSRNPLGQQVGLVPVGWTDEAATDPVLGALARAAATGAPTRAIQWNDDVVTLLPYGASVLAETPQEEIQAVRFAATVWGVQFHPEADAEIAAAWAAGDADRHRALGIDTTARLDQARAAASELEATWRGLADAFARVAADDWPAP
ncbi:type 1 glutamine amidotransferase [Nocardioides sp. AE5]|uniref:type 1 glutamine amidotransferase n=1 Tax=Nocardioides sp. AE5 TaxID=2962573 RepID=UPI002880E8FA|nr:type 1 glutamine amidotransferase [Nocardioides sp. AE5]MDT0201632.1 type 1 glutamine amidotransferase [Nocardioides sp. AE5]